MPLQSDAWTLDSWGTWANRLTLSPTADTNDDPQYVDAWSVDHVPDPRAAISSVTRTRDEYPGGDPQQIAVIPPDHDAAGNIVYDGTYIYQYDAWSRLVQVNLIAEPPVGGGPTVGDSVPGTTRLAGALVKHFTYDGLGRLVRVLSPYPEPGAAPPEGWTVAPVRSERLYYDGVRRIQEVYTDPLLALGESAAQGNSSAQGAVGEGQEEEGQTLEGEEGQIESGSGEPGGEEPPGPPPNTCITYLEREYLWGPRDGITGGAGAGLDELVAICDIDRRAWWTLLDVSGDVVAIVDDGASTAHGYGTGTPSTSTARLCAQFCYDAYGALLSIQGLHPFPDPRTGHKGLHLDRFDAGVADPLSGAAIARHEVGATHAYFVRNRHYAPELGRFVQRDPNATGGVPCSADLYLGHSLPGAVQMFRIGAHLIDGVGVYGALRSAPWSHADPTGMFSLVDMGFSAGVSAMLFGVVNGAIHHARGGSFLRGFARGYLAGYAGGTFGYAASASGLFTSLAARGAAFGVADGATSAAVDGVLDGRSTRDVVAMSIFGGLTGGVLGGWGGKAVSWVGSRLSANKFATALSKATTPGVRTGGQRGVQAGYSEAGYQFQKHYSRRPDLWPKPSGGSVAEFNRLGEQELRAIVGDGTGFVDTGTFLEKFLPDGRGVRLQHDFTFKGFLDP